MRSAYGFALLLFVISSNIGFASEARIRPVCSLSQSETDNIVTLRRRPESDAPILKRLPLDSLGIEQRTISADGQWVEVRHEGAEGWIAARFVRCRYAPSDARMLVGDTARQVIQAIGDGNWGGLAMYIHPEKGLRLSPYAYVDTDADQVIKARDFESLVQGGQTRVWGYHDGTGDPVRLSLARYLERYLRDHAYWQSRHVTFNHLRDTGNTADNIEEVYPHAITVEYYLDGLDSALYGTTWSSLRLVFERRCNRWYLVGIVHAAWTV